MANWELQQLKRAKKKIQRGNRGRVRRDQIIGLPVDYHERQLLNGQRRG